jgi:hypothetical protein
MRRRRKQPMRGVAGEDGAEPSQQEGGIGGAPKQLHAGEQLIENFEHRRVPAERIEQHQADGAGEEADIALPKLPAQRRPRQQQQRQGTEIQHPMFWATKRPVSRQAKLGGPQ